MTKVPLSKILLTSPILLVVFICLITIFSPSAYALTVITDCVELQDMNTNLTEDYELGNDIDCDVSPYNTGNGFVPVGDNSTPFEGTFDGKMFAINGLFINRIGAQSVGLFGEADNATISNVRLIDIDITGRIYSGGLVGYGTNVSIDKASSTGNVSSLASAASTTNYAGGIGGSLIAGSEVTNSFSTAVVSSSISGSGSQTLAGGLVGAFAGTIQNSYSAGSSSATGPTSGAGGLVGQITSSTVQNSFSTSTLSAFTEAGGMAATAGLTTFTNSYSLQTPFIDNSSGNTLNGGSTAGVALSAFYESDPLHAVYIGSPTWNFDSVWMFEDSSSLPVFYVEPEGEPTSSPSSSSTGQSNKRSSGRAPTCQDSAPTSSPDLFQIDVSNTTATLYFAPSANSEKYFISYGNDESSSGYGVEINTGHSTGVLLYTINSLQPNQAYTFTIRGGNGCATGEWSNEMKIMTSRSALSATSNYKNFRPSALSVFP